MIDELGDLLEEFPGASNRTRCFAHVINLVAKTALRQFDTSKAKADDALKEAEAELRALAEGIDIEEAITKVEVNGEGDDDDDDGWIDEQEALDEQELAELEDSVRPMKLVLTKVSNELKLVMKT